nr:ribbon-helix-helix protein, CopG family [Dyella mobilis]
MIRGRVVATSLKIDEELKGRIQHLADLRHRSAHWIMCEAIKEYVVREEARESFKQEAVRAWESYKANGRHLTLEEADAWLAQLEAGKDAELPECHE